MATSQGGIDRKSFRTLFHAGAIGELTDGQLLERFASGGEAAELAFAALVERHGPVVLRVCRSILRDEHDAQDAFQATFLVLVRKARSLWVRDSLGPWLHAVAYRAARCDRADRDRRRSHERRAAEAAPTLAAPADGRDELHGLLHEEIERLPARYRFPVILCDLGGRTYEQAARHLGCPVGTVKSRLTRGRERLRGRLTRRGVGPVIGLGAVLAAEVARAAVPARLAAATVRAAIRSTAIGVPVGAVPARAQMLAKGVMRNMTMVQLRTAAITPLLVLTIGAVVIAQQGTGRDAVAEAQVQGEAGRPAVKSPVKPPTRLRDAVREFNAGAAKNPVGKDQPPLTDEEVVASIRGWIREMRPPISDDGFDAFQNIAKSGELPAGATLTSITSWVGYRGFHFDVWWVDLTIPFGDGQGYTYRVRDRMIRSRLLTRDERVQRDRDRPQLEDSKIRPEGKR